MAEKELDEKETEGGEKKKSGNLLLIVIIVVLLLILIIGAVVGFLMMGNHDESAGGNEVAPAHKEAPADAHKTEGGRQETGLDSATPISEIGIMFPLDPFTINLLSESGRRYLKVEMNLELEGEELSIELDAKKPVIRDIVIRLLSSKSIEEISTAKGKEKIKEQIVSEMNARLKDGRVKNVYFTDFVVQ